MIEMFEIEAKILTVFRRVMAAEARRAGMRRHGPRKLQQGVVRVAQRRDGIPKA
ncbi:hypothetical protein [Sphingomonas bacterium]|uniref:hypothetical protein n=1 Tax=Sphingomonas bacterium TaxID=1895847 RepID=UPI001575E7F2|nr:hypothetical protein [Sphingomonas bacterium]